MTIWNILAVPFIMITAKYSSHLLQQPRTFLCNRSVSNS